MLLDPLFYYILSPNAILLNLSLFIFMEHYYFEDFPAVFTRVLWLVSLGVSRDNGIIPMTSFWKRSFWK